MKDYKFHTNIKCSSCEAKISKIFETEPKIKYFEVDLENIKRPLKVKVEDSISQDDIVKLVKSAGFEANSVKGIFDFLK